MAWRWLSFVVNVAIVALLVVALRRARKPEDRGFVIVLLVLAAIAAASQAVDLLF